LERVVDLTRRLISIPSVIGMENEISNFISDYISDGAGIEPQFTDVPGFGPYLIARSPKIDGAPTIVLNAHMDTVSPVAAWDQDPFSPQEKDGKLFGLGSSDMKAGLAIIIEAFIDCANDLDINLVFTSCPDEEGYSTGVNQLLSDSGLKGDLCLIPEPSDERIMLGVRGRFVIEIEVNGRAAHGARPDEGVNAIEDAALIVSRFPELPMREHDLFERGSVCTLRMEGGTESLSVPDLCRIIVDRHIVPGETEEHVILDIQDLIRSIGIESRWKVSVQIRPTPYPKPYLFDPDEGLIEDLIDHFRDTYHKPPVFMYGKSVGDYNFMAQRMPTIVFGPIGGMWHQAGEWVDVASIERTLDFYTRFIKKISKKE